MSTLKDLHDKYANKDQSIPVEYCSSAGRITRGVISRLLPGGGIQIMSETYTQVTVLGVNVTGQAGMANVREWCLSREARLEYIRIEEAKKAAALEPDGTEQMMHLFGDLKGKVKDVDFYRVIKWPNRTPELISGYVSVNAESVGQPFCGWIIYKDGKHEFTVEDMLSNKGVELVRL